MNITVGQTLKEMTDPCRKWSSAAAHKPRRETSGFVGLLVEVHATRSPLGVQRVGLCTSTEGGTVQSLVREILQATHQKEINSKSRSTCCHPWSRFAKRFNSEAHQISFSTASLQETQGTEKCNKWHYGWANGRSQNDSIISIYNFFQGKKMGSGCERHKIRISVDPTLNPTGTIQMLKIRRMETVEEHWALTVCFPKKASDCLRGPYVITVLWLFLKFFYSCLLELHSEVFRNEMI